MGCPAPKVAGNGGGSALMRDIPLAERIIQAVVGAVDVPVTVKMRTGWDGAHISAVELALAAESAGAAAVTVHGRTREQMYAPPVDIKTIAEVKRAVKIPVIANGDINSGAAAKNMYENTGCDFVSVGRAARGNPFIFIWISQESRLFGCTFIVKNEGIGPPAADQPSSAVRGEIRTALLLPQAVGKHPRREDGEHPCEGAGHPRIWESQIRHGQGLLQQGEHRPALPASP